MKPWKKKRVEKKCLKHKGIHLAIFYSEHILNSDKIQLAITRQIFYLFNLFLANITKLL